MSRQRSFIRQIALVLSLVYFTLTGMIMFGAGGHLLMHGQMADHAAEHASFVCTWMCAASSFVHTEDQRLNQGYHPPMEGPTTWAGWFFASPSVLSHHIRPPPHA